MPAVCSLPARQRLKNERLHVLHLKAAVTCEHCYQLWRSLMKVPWADCCALSQREPGPGLAAGGEVGDEETARVIAAGAAAAVGAAARFLCASAPL